MTDRPAETVEFHYVKGKDFRTVLAEGVVGSLNPSGRIVCAFYHERAAIPQSQKFEASGTGELLKFLSAEGRSGFVRELEIALSFDLSSAKGLIEFLQDRVDELEKDLEEGAS